VVAARAAAVVAAPPLRLLLPVLGRRSGGGGARGGGGGGGNSRMERLVETPLRKLTGENHENADAWRDWWKGARASFQFD